MIRQLFRTVRDKLHSLAKFGQKKPQQLPDHHHAKPPEDSPSPPRKRNKPRKDRPRWSLNKFPVEPEEGKTRFHDLSLSLGIMHAIADLEFKYCTPIQAESLPHTLKGNDLVGQAQTGTGKTAAFLITILLRLQRQASSGKRPSNTPKALILAPTRELAIQIGKDARALSKYLRVRIVDVFGGADYRKQQEKLNGIVDIVVATPGRLLDFHRQKIVKLDQVDILVIDEADRMLDMGFIPDVKQIVYSTPHKDKRQTLFFSATFTEDVKRLAEQWTRQAIRIQIEPDQVASDTVDQKVYIVTSEQKYPLLYNLVTQQNLQRVMVFSNRRHETRSLSERLRKDGIRCAMLSGDVPQHKRTRTLDDFRNGKIRVLVATDVAARGIHIEGVSHVMNFNLPQDPEDYVHRIGRTGRAGEKGISISFACEEDAFQIPAIQDYLGMELSCVTPEDNLLTPVPSSQKKPTPKPQATAQAKEVVAETLVTEPAASAQSNDEPVEVEASVLAASTEPKVPPVDTSTAAPVVSELQESEPVVATANVSTEPTPPAPVKLEGNNKNDEERQQRPRRRHPRRRYPAQRHHRGAHSSNDKTPPPEKDS